MLLVGAEGRDRDVAEWQACVEVVRNLGAYRPSEFRLPEGWTREDAAAIDALRGLRGIEEVRLGAQACPGSFGRWRAAVTDFEALEARKLQTLAWVLEVLYRIREQAKDTEKVDALATRIGDLLTIEWRAAPELGADHRAWASRATRREDLLPRHWRYV